MKRSPLRRRTPLRARIRLQAWNRGRRAKLYERNYGSKADWIRSLPCLRCRLPGDQGVQAAHVRTRGSGGDKTDLVPLCDVRGCHREQEGLNVAAYLELTGIDLTAKAARLEREWRETMERIEARWE